MEAVAAVAGVDPADTDSLPVLESAVDAEALEDAVFAPPTTPPRADRHVAVTVTYAGYLVTLDSSGTLSVYDRE